MDSRYSLGMGITYRWHRYVFFSLFSSYLESHFFSLSSLLRSKDIWKTPSCNTCFSVPVTWKRTLRRSWESMHVGKWCVWFLKYWHFPPMTGQCALGHQHLAWEWEITPKINMQCKSDFGSADEDIDRVGITVQLGQLEQLKQLTQLEQLDKMFGLSQNSYYIFVSWWHLDPAEEIGRADRERGPAASRAKSIPYLRPTSARRRDMIWKCRIVHWQLMNINAGIICWSGQEKCSNLIAPDTGPGIPVDQKIVSLVRFISQSRY